MARLPGYIQLEGKPYLQGGKACQTMRVRVWHPSLLVELWRSMDVQPGAMRPFVVGLAWLYLNWKSLAKP